MITNDRNVLVIILDINSRGLKKVKASIQNITKQYSNIIVKAGAGTGKTYSMVSRVSFLCNKKSRPIANIFDELAMVTFTNDAADNMKK